MSSSEKLILCPDCNKRLPKSSFHYGNELRRICADCFRERAVKRKRHRVQTAMKLFNGVCAVCGKETDEYDSEFHHVDPRTKEFQPADALNGAKYMWFYELAKCVLVCTPCHKDIHRKDSKVDHTKLVPSFPIGFKKALEIMKKGRI